MSKNQNTKHSSFSIQIELDLRVVASTEVNGIEMGVLNDGTPFLTGRSLAKLCGIAPSTMNEWGEITPQEGDRLRAGKMATILSGQGFEGDRFFLKIPFCDQPEVNAYPDAVCMSFLEYYAFEAGEKNCTQKAKDNYRILARQRLRDFIYQQTGYDPRTQVFGCWKHFHDRLLQNPAPRGYFSVFQEVANIVLASISAGLEVDEHTVPDISVGSAWSIHWKQSGLSVSYGERIKHLHVYPDYFPQALANGNIEAYLYPLNALGDFRGWLESEYLPKKYPAYLKTKAKQGRIPSARVIPLLKALEPLELPKLKLR